MAIYHQRQNFGATLAGDEVSVILMWYDGTGATATVDWASAEFDFLVDAALDTSVNGDGTITDAEAATIGALADLVNASTDGTWHATIVGALRSDDTTDILPLAAADALVTNLTQGGGGVDFRWDFSDLTELRACLGVEADETIHPAARLSVGNVFALRDIDEGATTGGRKAESRSTRVARLTRADYTVGNSDTDDVGTAKVYRSCTQAADDTVPFTLPLSADLVSKTSLHDPPSEFVSELGSRIVVTLDGAGTSASTALVLDVLGGYGGPGLLR